MRFADIEIGMEFSTTSAGLRLRREHAESFGLRYCKVSDTEAVRVVRSPKPDGSAVMEPLGVAPVTIDPDEQVDFVMVKKEPDDPLALRASVGGNDDAGFYCVYRGDRAAVANMLEKVVKDLREGL